MNWEQVEEWECPQCGEDGESIYCCSFCSSLKRNEPVSLNLYFSNEEESEVNIPRGIMFYSSSVMNRRITQKYWGDYEFVIYPKEFILPRGKDLSLLHIHVISRKGNIRIYLDDFRVEEKFPGIPKNEWSSLSEFVKKHYYQIIFQIGKILKTKGIIK